LGRFITEDPVKDGVNWFVYCGNNPMVFVDPTGLTSINQVPQSTHPKESSSRGSYYHLSQEEIDKLKDRTDLEWRAKETKTALLEVVQTLNEGGFGVEPWCSRPHYFLHDSHKKIQTRQIKTPRNPT